MFFVGKPQEDMIHVGLPGMPGLCTCSLGRRYNLDILGEAGLAAFFPQCRSAPNAAFCISQLTAEVQQPLMMITTIPS